MTKIIITSSLQKDWPVWVLQYLIGKVFDPILINPGIEQKNWDFLISSGYLVNAQKVIETLEDKNILAAKWLVDKYIPGIIGQGRAYVFFAKQNCFETIRNED
jgi:hypothetical protein